MVVDPKVDLPLTAMSTLAVWAVLAARRRPALIWLAWGFGALAMLSKGPIGLVLPVLAVGPELVRPGGVSPAPTLLRRVLSVKPVRGLLLVAVVVSPFYVATALDAGGESAGLLLWSQSFGRIFGGSGWRDSTTPLYFVHTGLWALLPFSPLLVVALGRRLVTFAKTRALPPDVARVPLWWFTLPFAVISLSSFKLPQYVYWLGPPAALLAAGELCALSEAGHRRWQRGLLALAAVATALLGVAVWFAFPSHWPWLIVSALVPAAAWLATRRAEPLLRTTALCVAATLTLLAYFHAGLQPALLEYQPSREIGALVRERDPAAAVLPCVEVAPRFSLAFYAQRDVAMYDVPALKAAVEAGAVHVALVADGQLEALRAAGLRVESLGRFSTYPTSVPRRAFLVAATRESVLGHVELVSVAPGAR